MNGSGLSKALAVFAHPDDGEFLAGGTLAKWSSEGKEVVLCIVTNGALGSNDPSVTREDLTRRREGEQREAAELLGVRELVFLGYEDGYVEDSHKLRCDLIKQIRIHKPDVVVGMDPSTYYVQQFYVNHPDHRRLGEALLAAVNPGAATLPLYRSELYDRGFEPHKLKACYLAGSLAPDHFIDIGDFMELKTRALRAHRSQMAEWAQMEQTVTAMAEWMAAESGRPLRYAEGFKAFFFPQTDEESGQLGAWAGTMAAGSVEE